MYEQIARNKRDSVVLVACVALLLLTFGYVIARAYDLPGWSGLLLAAGAAALTFIVSYYEGSAILLRISGARPVAKRDAPKLYNVVEEMAIASGLPMPQLYIIEDSAPNAFATGQSPKTAAVAVTRGLLDKLNREELQGVIAHEMAHIRNYDIRLSMLLAVLVGGVALIADFFVRSTFYGGDRRRSKSDGQAIFMVIGIVFAILAPLFAKMLEMAVSRRREYLADASGALMTRYPPGLASALEKISADTEVLEAANRATQHLYIVNPIKSFEERAKGLFDTHPPIADRVQRLRAMAFQAGPAETGPAAAPTAAPRTAPPVAGAMPLVSASTGAVPPPTGPAVPTGRAPCPRCQEPLGVGQVAGRPVRGCRHCGGLWLGGDDFAALLRSAPDRLDAADRRFPNVIGQGWDRVAGRCCPDCRIPLAPHRLDDAGGPALDRCPRCGGIWFDDGELSAVVQAARAGAAPQRTA